MALSADGHGSVSPQSRFPYSFAVATGLTAAGLKIVAEKSAGGRLMSGCGFKDTRQVCGRLIEGNRFLQKRRTAAGPGIGAQGQHNCSPMPPPALSPAMPSNNSFVGGLNPMQGRRGAALRLPRCSSRATYCISSQPRPLKLCPAHIRATLLTAHAWPSLQRGIPQPPFALTWCAALPLPPTLASTPQTTHCQVVELGGQKGCVVLDLCEQPKTTQIKFLPGLLKAAEEGYYAVIGKRVSEWACH
jgi:hypothetical protein